jgi:hypothetical protein
MARYSPYSSTASLILSNGLDLHMACHPMLHMLRFVTTLYCLPPAQKLIQGLFIIVVTPNRIAQYLYDRARMLAETRFGWLALSGAIGVQISFYITSEIQSSI